MSKFFFQQKFVLLAIVAVAFAKQSPQYVRHHEALHARDMPAHIAPHIELVNKNPASTWKAGVNLRFWNTTIAQAKMLCGVKKGGPVLEESTIVVATDIPVSFDAR